MLYAMYITRKVGPKGQVVIPEQVRKELGIKPGMEVEFDVRDNETIMRLANRLKTVHDFCSFLPKNSLGKIDSDKLYEEEMEERHGHLFRR